MIEMTTDTSPNQGQANLGKPLKLNKQTRALESSTKNPNKIKPVVDAEWEFAKNYFLKNPTVVKLNCKNNNSTTDQVNLNHSFVKIPTEGGRFLIVAKHGYLGHGSYGVVKSAQAKKVNKNSELEEIEKPYIVKIQAKDIDMNDKEYFTLKKLQQEHGVLNQINGKNKSYLICDRYEGQTLYDFLDGGKSGETYYFSHLKNLTPTQKYLIALRCAQAVEKMHQNGIIHNDLKPENIMIHEITLPDGSNDYQVNIIDFGFADQIYCVNHVVNHKKKGTPKYDAPEKFQSQHSTKSDIYALGCIFTHTTHPYKGYQLYHSVMDLQDNIFKNMRNLKVELRPEMSDVVDHLKAKIPEGLHIPPYERAAIEQKKQLRIEQEPLQVKIGEFSKNTDLGISEETQGQNQSQSLEPKVSEAETQEKTFLEKHGYKIAIVTGLALLAGAAIVAGIFTAGIVPAITIAIAAGVIGVGGGLGLGAVVGGAIRGIYQNHIMDDNLILTDENNFCLGQQKTYLPSQKSKMASSEIEETTSCFSAIKKQLGLV